MADDRTEPKPGRDEPPPPYPGLQDCANGQPPSTGATQQQEQEPPPYPGLRPSAQNAPPAYGVDSGSVNAAFSQGVPFFAQPIVVDRTPPTQAAAGIFGDCPNCRSANLVATPDLTLIVCLVVLAFLFTPFTLCCIPCAIRQECPNCGYRGL